jgi:hypothetical protein
MFKLSVGADHRFAKGVGLRHIYDLSKEVKSLKRPGTGNGGP